jgi:hypothetical protein
MERSGRQRPRHGTEKNGGTFDHALQKEGSSSLRLAFRYQRQTDREKLFSDIGTRMKFSGGLYKGLKIGRRNGDASPMLLKLRRSKKKREEKRIKRTRKKKKA